MLSCGCLPTHLVQVLVLIELGRQALLGPSEARLLALGCAIRRHTSRFIIIYLTFLPFALWPFVKWLL